MRRPNGILANLLYPATTIPGLTTTPKDMYANIGDGPVPASVLAAWNEAVNYRIQMMTHGLQQTWLNSCREMEITACLHPGLTHWRHHNTVRDPMLYAKAGNDFVEVW